MIPDIKARNPSLPRLFFEMSKKPMFEFYDRILERAFATLTPIPRSLMLIEFSLKFCPQ